MGKDIYEKAEDFLKERFGEEVNLSELDVFIDPDVGELEDYQNNVNYVKALYQSGNKEFRKVLWNNLMEQADSLTRALYRGQNWRTIDPTVILKKEDFTREEFLFLKKMIQASVKDPSFGKLNVNQKFSTARLILRPPTARDGQLLKRQLDTSGEFLDYVGIAPTKYSLDSWSNIEQRRLYFSIYSNRIMIGYLALNERDKHIPGCMNIEYYIFPKFRRQGYAIEAINALVDKAFLGELCYSKRTEYAHRYRARNIEISLIRAKIKTVNYASINTIKKCGFICEGIIHKDVFDDKQCWDMAYYYIDKNIWETTKKRDYE